MGLFDLFLQSDIQGQSDRADMLAKRVSALEGEVQHLKAKLTKVIVLLERHTGEDVDRTDASPPHPGGCE